MKLRFLSFCSAVVLLSTMISACAPSGNVNESTETSNTSEKSVYPSWYNSSQSVTSSPTSYQGYATALAADSTGALRKALEQAENSLESGISAKLESIRTDAVVELGSDSGLDSPRFIVVLRRAENEVSDISQKVNALAEENNPNGYRGFVQVQVEKEELIKELDRRFSGYANAWNTMKDSEAFSGF